MQYMNPVFFGSLKIHGGEQFEVKGIRLQNYMFSYRRARFFPFSLFSFHVFLVPRNFREGCPHSIFRLRGTDPLVQAVCVGKNNN